MLAYKLRRLWQDIEVTVEEGIEELSSLCATEVIMGGLSIHTVPEPREMGKVLLDKAKVRPLKNVQFCSSSRKAKISTIGIHRVFRGLKFEPDVEIGQKGAFFKGLKVSLPDAIPCRKATVLTRKKLVDERIVL